MTKDQFLLFIEEAQHELRALNTRCRDELGLGTFDRWDHDSDLGTVIFSNDGIPTIVAQAQVIGTTSTRSNTWLWSWANESLPLSDYSLLSVVRDFGKAESIDQLVEAEWPDDEYLGWEMTAVSVKLIGAVAGYRGVLDSRGYIYFAFTALERAKPTVT